MASKSSDAASKAIGSKLQAGWALIQQTCPTPNCNTPLVQNKQKQMFCVRCEAWVVPEAEAARFVANYPTAPSSAAAAAPAPSSTTATDTPAERPPLSPPVSPSVIAQRKRRQEISSKLGQKLLMGWAMLDRECPQPQCGCVLMKPKDGPMTCVACGLTISTSGDGQETIAYPSGADGSLNGATGPRPSSQADSNSTSRKTAVADEDEDEDEDEAIRRRFEAAASKKRERLVDIAFKVAPGTSLADLLPEDDLDEKDSAAVAAQASRKPQAPAPSGPSVRKRVRDSDAVSVLMGEKLLAGWAMMEECCDNEACACPLMKNSKGDLVCLSCDNVTSTRSKRPTKPEPTSSKPAANAPRDPTVSETKKSVDDNRKPAASVVESSSEPSAAERAMAKAFGVSVEAIRQGMSQTSEAESAPRAAAAATGPRAPVRLDHWTNGRAQPASSSSSASQSKPSYIASTPSEPAAFGPSASSSSSASAYLASVSTSAPSSSLPNPLRTLPTELQPTGRAIVQKIQAYGALLSEAEAATDVSAVVQYSDAIAKLSVALNKLQSAFSVKSDNTL